MQAVILAGGLGTRLWPLTERIPKPMMPVAGAPYLQHQLLLLRAQGIRDVVLLIGYLGGQIMEYFGDGNRFGMSIRYAIEETPLGTGGALRAAAGLLEDNFLLLYGDSYLPIRYGPVAELLQRSAADGVVVAYDNGIEDTTVANNIAIDAAGRIMRYDKQAQGDPALRYVEAGVLALRAAVVAEIPPGVVSLEKDIFPVLIERRGLLAYPTQQRFYDIGTPDRLKAIEEFLKHDHYADSVSN